MRRTLKKIRRGFAETSCFPRTWRELGILLGNLVSLLAIICLCIFVWHCYGLFII